MAKVDLFPDFKEFLGLLNSEGVRYLVLGGYAVNLYGYRRSTDDLDVWIATDAENARKVSRVMRTFGGFPAAQVKPTMFQAKGMLFIMGREPVRIDLLTDPSGVEFDACYVRRREVEWDGIKVPLIALEDLKVNKQASGREKDLADLRNLPPARARRPRKRPPR